MKVAPLVGFRVSDSTPRAGSRVRFSGTVRPRHNGRRVYVQRKVGTGVFVTIRKTTLEARHLHVLQVLAARARAHAPRPTACASSGTPTTPWASAVSGC